MDSGEQLRSFSKSNLREMTIIKTSTKTSYRGKLTPQEIADVVGYLVSLKGSRGDSMMRRVLAALLLMGASLAGAGVVRSPAARRQRAAELADVLRHVQRPPLQRS